jgi:hypothetical protein
MSKAYKYYQDPGHGWIAVKRAEVKRLNLEEKISSYSYQRGASVYLEEDSDASKFFAAKKALGEQYSFDSRHSNKSSPIRSYDSYKKPVVVVPEEPVTDSNEDIFDDFNWVGSRHHY